jgi:hypothetical protein
MVEQDMRFCSSVGKNDRCVADQGGTGHGTVLGRVGRG